MNGQLPIAFNPQNKKNQQISTIVGNYFFAPEKITQGRWGQAAAWEAPPGSESATYLGTDSGSPSQTIFNPYASRLASWKLRKLQVFSHAYPDADRVTSCNLQVAGQTIHTHTHTHKVVDRRHLQGDEQMDRIIGIAYGRTYHSASGRLKQLVPRFAVFLQLAQQAYEGLDSTNIKHIKYGKIYLGQTGQ